MSIATLFEDRKVSGQYRVEAQDDDGGMEVAVFDGPNALDRAIIFASEYYGKWNDAHGLTEPVQRQDKLMSDQQRIQRLIIVTTLNTFVLVFLLCIVAFRP